MTLPTTISTIVFFIAISTQDLRGQIVNYDLQFFGEGNIQKSLNSGEELPANTGLGIYYRKKVATPFLGMDDLRVAMSINVASSTDTIVGVVGPDGTAINVREFGSYVLLPGNSKQGASLDVRGYFKKDHKLRPHFGGLNFNFIASNRTFRFGQEEINASVVGCSAGVFHDFTIDSNETDNLDYAILLEMNLLFRGIYGDLGQRGSDRDEARNRIFGTTKVPYLGGELKAGFKLNNILAELSLPFLFASEENEVPGLTNIQFITTIKFVGGFPILRSGGSDGKGTSPLL